MKKLLTFLLLAVGLMAQPTTPIGNATGTTVVLTRPGIATTSTNAYTARNSTPSTAIATVQYSPRFLFTGHAWNSTATAADNYLEAIEELRPVSAATPTSLIAWGFRRSTDGSTGSFTDRMTLTSAGLLTVANLTDSGLTAGRVTFATTAGALTDSANLTFTDGTTTGQLIVPVGAVGTPSLTFLGDTDNGLYYIGANAFGLTAGGTQTASFSATAGISLTALGTNQNITLTPSGTGLLKVVGASETSWLGAAPTAATYGALFFATATPSLTNYSIAGNGSATSIGAPSGAIQFLMANVERARFAQSSGNLLLGGLATDGAGNKVLQLPGTNVINFGATANATIGVSADTTAGVLTFTAPSAGSFLLTGGNVALSAAYIGSTSTLSGAGAANVTTETTKITSTGVLNAITLADGVDGQTKIVLHDVDGGSFVLTPTTKTGWTTFTSTVVGESITLKFVTTRGWMVTGSYLGVIAP